jgi:hypothetical protein
MDAMTSHLTFRPLSHRQPPGLGGLPTHYHSKSQGLVAIKDMQIDHLNAAINKLTGASGTEHTLAAMRAEKARRT